MKNGLFITESTKQSKGRKYKCPYCDRRDFKQELVTHVEEEHSSLIPKGYTAARVVFNMVNKKEQGTCVCGCGRPTAWREDLWRYDRYATDTCKEKYSKEMKQRMVKTYGKEHLLGDVEMQNKMLAGRSISGTYKFTYGGKMNYVGSYEHKFLEFCDKVMNYRCSDIEQPGPSIPYKFNDQDHVWITDFYIPSANLVLDIKDGGSNPNNRSMEEYREKQKAKEDAIIKDGRYNYIRLTDNNFAQLMLVLAEIKERMVDTDNDGDYKPIIKINESSIPMSNKSSKGIIKSMMECIIGITPNGQHFYDTDAYVVNYMNKNTFTYDQGIADSEELNYILTTDKNGNIKLNNKDLLEGTDFQLYKFNGERYKSSNNPTTLFEMLTGSECLNSDQLEYDDRFERIFTTSEEDKVDCVEATILGSDYKIQTISPLTIEESNIDLFYDSNGIFLENTITGLRSKSYENIKLIPQGIINYIRKGVL